MSGPYINLTEAHATAAKFSPLPRAVTHATERTLNMRWQM